MINKGAGVETRFLIIGAVIFGFLLLIIILFLAFGVGGKKGTNKATRSKKELAESYEKIIQNDMYHVFGKEFQEELRNKARLDFQRVINENAMFLQQDLRLTTSGLNDYMKNEISSKLEEEFSAYKQTIKDVEKMAADSITATVTASQKLQDELNQRILDETETRKAQIIDSFQEHMSDVAQYYITQALGEEIDLKDQLPYILRQLESQQEAIRKDMWL